VSKLSFQLSADGFSLSPGSSLFEDGEGLGAVVGGFTGSHELSLLSFEISKSIISSSAGLGLGSGVVTEAVLDGTSDGITEGSVVALPP